MYTKLILFKNRLFYIEFSHRLHSWPVLQLYPIRTLQEVLHSLRTISWQYLVWYPIQVRIVKYPHFVLKDMKCVFKDNTFWNAEMYLYTKFLQISTKVKIVTTTYSNYQNIQILRDTLANMIWILQIVRFGYYGQVIM